MMEPRFEPGDTVKINGWGDHVTFTVVVDLGHKVVAVKDTVATTVDVRAYPRPLVSLA